ncbi:hypothetical protein [Nostoc piscinale]|uniref:hypothetical protein n=1 Tax=Nostoc piscinale TaxID=224012 RepID=UPI0039A6EEB0
MLKRLGVVKIAGLVILPVQFFIQLKFEELVRNIEIEHSKMRSLNCGSLHQAIAFV